ncbi:MAG: hypothetical protein H9917_01955 [Candidatus Oceanisphaera merdipullorum]|nr:hypothetical protein [Candidatus Oceanisphaera merdipullorum]
MKSNDKKSFTKREWIQLIITLTIAQAFFWYAVFENSQSASALGYVSFAGTLVSIILAVLAIGYTYGESVSQKNKGDGLASQISTLGSLIESVELEAKSLEKIQDIAKELSSFIGGYRKDKEASEDHLQYIKNNISVLTSLKSSSSNNKEIEFVGPNWPVQKILKNRSPLDEACYLMLLIIEHNQDGMGLKNMAKHLEGILSKTPMELSPKFFHGALFTQYSLLLNLGFIEEEEGYSFQVKDDLREFILNNMVTPSSTPPKEGTYDEMIHNLYKEVNSLN